MQTNLEKDGIVQRGTLELNNDYKANTNVYTAGHRDTMSDGDPQGKGVNMAGHQFTLPDHNLVGAGISRSNFNSDNGGGEYDIHGYGGHDGRLAQTTHNIYSKVNQYPGTIDESGNVGQYHT